MVEAAVVAERSSIASRSNDRGEFGPAMPVKYKERESETETETDRQTDRQR